MYSYVEGQILLHLTFMGRAIISELYFLLFSAVIVSVSAAGASLVFVLSGGCQQPVLCAWSGAVDLMSITLVCLK